MALFTDGPIAWLQDLRSYESAVLDLASTEGVDVSAKLRIAQREIATELIPFLAHAGAPSRDLSDVVVTDDLLTAHTLRTLTLIYRDLYQSRMNDRFEGKWREYAAQSARAMQHLLEAGVGICSAPIPRGDVPLVDSVDGGLRPERTYYVRIAWSRDAGVTGAVSEPVSLWIASGRKAKVGAPPLPDGVTGWVLYAGTSAQQMYLQTPSAMTDGGVWIEPDSGLRSDLASWHVQKPDRYVMNRREILRG